MSNNKHKHKLSDLRKFAKALHLDVVKYNPGDNLRYKIVRAGQDYFETDGLYRPGTLSEAHAFLAGLACRETAPAIRALAEGGAQ